MNTIEIAIVTNDNEFFYHFRRTIQLYFENASISPSLHYYQKNELLRKKLKNNVHFDLLFLDMKANNDRIRLAREIHQLIPAPVLVFFMDKHNSLSTLLRLQPFRIIQRESLTDELGECIKAVLYEIPDTIHRPYLILESGNSIYRIPIGQIRYIESINKQLHIITSKKTLVLRYPIGTVQDMLADCSFLRIHKSFLVNANYVARINTSEVILSDETSLPLSRYRSREVRQQFREAFQWDTVL